MKAICNRVALLEGMQLANSVVVARTPKPILQCVKLTASSDVIMLEATDLEVGIRFTDTQVEVEEPGSVVIPADRLNAILRESADETLRLEAEQTNCHIRGADAHFEIYGDSPDDFPPVAGFDGDPDLEITAGGLKELIARTLFASAKENTRYAINGIYWEVKGKKLQLVSTDGRRLALAIGELSCVNSETRGTIVPAKALNLAERLLGDVDEKVRVRFDDNQVIFGTRQAALSANLVEGNFPKYDDVIPKDCDKKIKFKRVALESAVRRAALLSHEESKGVRLRVSSGGVTFSSRTPERGQAQVDLSAEYEGPDVEIGFNPQYLTEVLRAVSDEETVQLELKAGDRPGVIKVGNNFVYVVMPVNLT